MSLDLCFIKSSILRLGDGLKKILFFKSFFNGEIYLFLEGNYTLV